MMTAARTWIIALSSIVSLLFGHMAWSKGTIEIFPLEELAPGMKGVGLTVFEGTEIEPFSVEVVGVLEGAGPLGPLIVIRVGGPAIERIGGFASGMSGSPIYVDGRLVGALGYGFEMSDHRIGLVTPARDMLDLVHELETAEPAKAIPTPTPPAPVFDFDMEIDGVRPIRTPMILSGLGGRSLHRAKEFFGDFDVHSVSLGRVPGKGEKTVEVRPGSAIGVQLVRGDVNITAIGTVTAVDEQGRFVAFGHPFLHKGVVDYIATSAEVVQTVSSTNFPFKLANPGGVIGSIGRDRGAGIAGQIGKEAHTIGFYMRLNDRDRGRKETFHVDVVNDESLASALLVIAALEGVDRAIDRIGGGTSWVNVHLKTQGEKWDMKWNNMYYSSTDVVALSLVDFAAAIHLLITNSFVDPGLVEVDLEVEIDSKRRTATIEQAVPSRQEVAVGETVDVRVTLRPYRAEPIEITLPLTIPDDIGDGRVTVFVRGGEYAFWSLGDDLFLDGLEEGLATEEDDETFGLVEFNSLEQFIHEFVNQPKNNDVIFEFYPPSAASQTSPADDTEGDEAGADGDEGWDFGSMYDLYDVAEPVKSIHSTEYVVRGETTFTLNLIRPRRDQDE